MTIEQFKSAMEQDSPPDGINCCLLALWHQGKGDWKTSHEIVQDEHGPDAALIHAYLHRVEGDEWNAEYWYRQAAHVKPNVSLEAEWHQLVQRFCD